MAARTLPQPQPLPPAHWCRDGWLTPVDSTTQVPCRHCRAALVDRLLELAVDRAARATRARQAETAARNRRAAA